MANFGTPPPDPIDAELWRLSRVSSMNWNRELAKCPRLLALLPQVHDEFDTATEQLKAAMMAAVNCSYDQYASESGDKKSAASEVLAGAALIGLLWQQQEKIGRNERPDFSGRRRSDVLKIRRLTATRWYHHSVAASTFQTRRDGKPSYEDECLEAFRDELIKVVQNARSKPAPIGSGEDVSEATSSKPATLSTVSGTPRADAERQLNGFNPDLYVHRSRQETRFDELVEQGKRLIIFVGQAGIGKSWLAKYVSRSPNGSDAPCIQLINGSPQMSDLQAAYTSLQIDTQHVIGASAESYLTHLIHCQQAPKFVVLDNLSSTDELTGLSLSGSKSTVVVTSRIEGDVPIGQAEILYLNKMRDDESQELIDRLLPSLQPRESMRLNFFLAGHPSAISYACRLIAYRGGADTWDFIDELDRNRPRIAKGVRTTEGATLETILASITAYLRESDEDAYELLALIGLLDVPSDSPRKRDFLKHYYAQAISGDYELPYTNAVLLLQKLGLVIVLESGELIADKLTCDFLFRSAYTAQVVSFISRIKNILEAYIRSGATPADPDFEYAMMLSIHTLLKIIMTERLRGKLGPEEAARWMEKCMGYDLRGNLDALDFESGMYMWLSEFEAFRRRELE